MVIEGSGIRVKVYPLCFEFGSEGEPQTKAVAVTIRNKGTNPLGEVEVRVMAAQDSAWTKGEYSLSESRTTETATSTIKVRAEERADEPDLHATIPISCKGPEEASELVARLVIEVGPAGGTETWVRGETEVYAGTNHVLPLWQVLKEEYIELEAGDQSWRAELDAQLPQNVAPNDDDDEAARADAERLARLFAIMHQRGRGLAALCLSGGGIRSATFNLGVLQGLARLGILKRFDYLSSVSGGGYIASWLSAWIHRAGIDAVAAKLAPPECDRSERTERNPLEPEPPEIRHLRQYSNYLTPRSGFLSADTWTLAAIFVRNLVLNQLVLIPILAAALSLPLLAAAARPGWLNPSPENSWLLSLALYGLSTVAGYVAFYQMNALRFRGRGQDEQWFLVRGIGPLLISATLMVMSVAWSSGNFGWREALLLALIFAVVMPVTAYALAGWQAGQDKTFRVDVGAAFAAGVVVALIYTWILVYVLASIRDRTLYAWLAPVLVLGPVLVGKTLFTGFVSLAEDFGRKSEKGDDEREWWARWSAWVLISLLGWLVVSGIALFGPRVLEWVGSKVAAYLAGGGLGLLTSLLGKAAATPSKDGQPAKQSTWATLALALVAPLFCVVLAILISHSTQSLVWFVQNDFEWIAITPWRPSDLSFVAVLLVALGLAVFGFGMGAVVNVNRFSLQAMYRNRLVRAYLGASRARRQPNRFTGFDSKDNLRLCLLDENRPLPVLNMALNLVGGEQLAWQERKATNFTATPLHCGSMALRPGYRRTAAYGGAHGMSLATAMATSGAAANPNMGYSSSPAIAVIMTLFNARLGIWLGNPGKAGSKRKYLSVPSFMRGGPRNSARAIFAEALGHTDEKHPYVNLSDGGHFDNLGLYEMVLRRCRWIVVCDAGCDRTGQYSDLGSAVRKIRIDFGIPIRFDPRINIASADESRTDGFRCAIGTIDYAAVDGAGTEPGTVIYVKPTICGDEPHDIFNYKRANCEFPHESTADQWFSESQFESYRALGQHTVEQILPDEASAFAENTFAELTDRARKHVKDPRRQ